MIEGLPPRADQRVYPREEASRRGFLWWTLVALAALGVVLAASALGATTGALLAVYRK